MIFAVLSRNQHVINLIPQVALILILTNRRSLSKLSDTFKTGLSDHHKLVCTILKSGGFKGTPIEKIYQSYKKFDVSNFKSTLKIELKKVKSESYGEFEAVFKRTE